MKCCVIFLKKMKTNYRQNKDVIIDFNAEDNEWWKEIEQNLKDK